MIPPLTVDDAIKTLSTEPEGSQEAVQAAYLAMLTLTKAAQDLRSASNPSAGAIAQAAKYDEIQNAYFQAVQAKITELQIQYDKELERIVRLDGKAGLFKNKYPVLDDLANRIFHLHSLIFDVI